MYLLHIPDHNVQVVSRPQSLYRSNTGTNHTIDHSYRQPQYNVQEGLRAFVILKCVIHKYLCILYDYFSNYLIFTDIHIYQRWASHTNRDLHTAQHVVDVEQYEDVFTQSVLRLLRAALQSPPTVL